MENDHPEEAGGLLPDEPLLSAKPRWIAIVVTFTQAVKLGLRPKHANSYRCPGSFRRAQHGAACRCWAMQRSRPSAPDIHNPYESQNAPTAADDLFDDAVIAYDDPKSTIAHGWRLALTTYADQDDHVAEQDGSEHFELALDTMIRGGK